MPAQKRGASEVETPNRRRSSRVSSASKKSVYFEDSDDSEEEESQPRKKQRIATPARKKSGPNLEDEEDAYKEESDAEEQQEQEDEESEMDESKPPKVTVIPLEQMRGTGGVDYEDYKVHKNTMLFLKDLKANNKRTWLKSHDGEYRRAWKDWQSFVDATSSTMTEVDETIPELPAKDVVFRIYRDIRFSKDSTPYKAHFSAAWSRTGRKGPYACYYIHCEPGNAFIGGGLWHPEAQHVQKLRRHIDRHPDRWREVFANQSLRETFFPKAKDVEGVIKAFVGKNQANALKKKPMGYEATHPDIELLKLKNFTLSTQINESILCEEDSQEKVAAIMRSMEGYVTFINSIVMPDPGLGEDSESDEENDDE